MRVWTSKVLYITVSLYFSGFYWSSLYFYSFLCCNYCSFADVSIRVIVQSTGEKLLLRGADQPIIDLQLYTPAYSNSASATESHSISDINHFLLALTSSELLLWRIGGTGYVGYCFLNI